jgi:molybdate transport system substrate-binding protein
MSSPRLFRTAAVVGCMVLATLAHAETLTVFAAASVKNALDRIAKGHEARSGDRIVVSYAASSALARQIDQGAPADVFVSADREWMGYLEKRGLVRPGSRVDLLRNRLAIVAPAAARTTLKIAHGFALASALGKERLAMADPAAVPAGRYGKAALEKLGVWPDVRTKIAAAADVRAALLLVARGEAPLGIVYITDAAVEPRVRVVDVFPEDTHPPIVYPAALTASAKLPAADRLLRALREPAARAIFDQYGFR